MTSTACERQWQAEALEDGRLEPNDRASFERHAATCRVCAAELSALLELRQKVAAFPDYRRTELEHRRARIALLAAAEQRSFRASSSPLRFAWVLAVPALVCALLLSRVWRSHATAPGFEVANVAHADWSAKHEGSTSRIALRDGVASFHVEHVAAAARFLVDLPDGQIEVRGTRFVVDVKAGVTRSVSVSEGVVWLRLGERLVVLKRGEAYRVDEQANVVGAASPAAVAAQPSVAPSAPQASAGLSGAPSLNSPATGRELDPLTRAAGASSSSAGVPAGHAAPSASASASASAAASQANAAAATGSVNAPVRAPTAGERFGEAMSAFAAGDYGRADALFAAFAREFPSDSRLEDAAFLRADARARRGDAAGAAALARDYLKRYPSGLRRPDAERLVGKPSAE
jgi:hypothetical protein